MINKKFTYVTIIVLILTALSILTWNSYQNQTPEKPKKQTSLPQNKTLEACGIENCHGLDITCGPNVPQMCNMSYILGDSCRQYAACEKKDSKCQLVKSLQFENCKSCVEECKSKFGDNDPDKLFTCESTCAK